MIIFKFRLPLRLIGLAIATLLVVSCATSKGGDSASTSTDQPTRAMSPAASKRYTSALENLQSGDFSKAQRTLQSLADDYNGIVGVWVNLAVARYQNGQLDTATDALNRAQEIDADIPEIHNLQGLIAVERGDYQAAEQHYLAALTIDADHSHSHYNLALLYDVFYQDIGQAVPHYDRYLALTDAEDTDTARWVEQLKRSLERGADK